MILSGHVPNAFVFGMPRLVARLLGGLDRTVSAFACGGAELTENVSYALGNHQDLNDELAQQFSEHSAAWWLK